MDIERQARLEAILENAVDAIITIDQQGTVEIVNPATTHLFGYQANEIIGQNVRMLMPSPYHEEHDGYLQNYRTTGKRKIIGIGREVSGRRKDGTIFPLHLAVSEFQVGERILFTGIIRDISDLKRAEAELKCLNEQLEQRVTERTGELRAAQAELLKKERLATLGQVSGGIAHEIRNPLNAVKTSAYYLLNAHNPSEAKVKEHLERIDRQVTLIDNVVTALSDVARMPEPKLRPQDLWQQLRDVLSSVALPSNIHVNEEVQGNSAVIVDTDEHQMSIVFRNLVRNACDAMPEGGTLTIGAQVDPTQVRVYVQDTGSGIAPQDLARITEPLYTTKARGMGLGLAISRAIVEKNKGKLMVESELGRGSVFSVVFRNNDV